MANDRLRIVCKFCSESKYAERNEDQRELVVEEFEEKMAE